MSAKTQFPGLNGLRMLAAGAVFLHHVENHKFTSQLPSLWSYPVFTLGKAGVRLFFVLSGFLITYLLLQEEAQRGRARVGAFYVRRILRIWPVYYLVLAAAFLLCHPFPGFVLTHPVELLLFLFLMPNVALSVAPPVPFASHMWSIGVEEQFYLVWPWLLRLCRRALPLLFLGLVVLRALARQAAADWRQQAQFYGDASSARSAALLFDLILNFELQAMALGGLAAWLLFTERRRALAVAYHPLTQVLAVLGSVFMLFVRGFRFQQELASAFFAILVLNVAANPRALLKLRGQLLDRLGAVSYGFYAYHPFAIALVGRGLDALDLRHPESATRYGLLLYSASFSLTVIAADLSYRLFEQRFLRLKDRFSPAAPVSGDPSP